MSQEAPTFEKIYRPENKEAVGSTQRVLQYYFLPDKNSHYILRGIWNFLQYVKRFSYLFYHFFVEHLMVFCRTLVGKHCYRLFNKNFNSWRMHILS
jgi:hypothetical protein